MQQLEREREAGHESAAFWSPQQSPDDQYFEHKQIRADMDTRQQPGVAQ